MLFGGVNFHTHIMFFKKVRMEGKASFPVWEMENEEPRTLQSHKHEPPGNTVKQLFIGNTATQRAARPLEERGWKTHTQQQQHNSLLSGGKGTVHFQGFGSAIPQLKSLVPK